MILTACQPANTITWESELITVNADGTGPGGMFDPAGWLSPDMITAVASPDGALVAFTATGWGYGPNDTNGKYDVYVRDRAAGATSLVSAVASGGDSGNGHSAGPTFSPDGRRVLFASDATNLTPSAGTGMSLYVRDLATETTSLVGSGATKGIFTPDGNRVVFTTSIGLVSEDLNDTYDVYLHDLSTGATELLSINAAGSAGSGQSAFPAVSPDGNAVAFASFADDLAPNDTNRASDVFIRDLATETTILLSTNAAGTQSANAGSDNPIFAPDGMSLVFGSNASDLGPTDTNGSGDVYIRELGTGATELVSVNATGSDSGAHGSGSSYASFSPDATKVVFSSSAGDLVDIPTGGIGNVFVRDLTTNMTALVSANAAGTGGGNSGSEVLPGIEFTADSSKVVFVSQANNLGPKDTNGVKDVYLRDLVRGTTSLVSANAEGTDAGNGVSTRPTVVGGGTAVLFYSEATDRVAIDTVAWPDFHLSTGRQADLTVSLTASPEPVPSGGDITYSLDVTNAGPDQAPDAIATLLLPEGTTLATTGPCAQSPTNSQLVSCSFGDLPAGGAGDAVVTARVDSVPGEVLVALAAVSSAIADPGVGNVVQVESPVV